MERATITENGRLSEIELNGMGHCYFQCLWPKNALESSSRYVFLDSSHFSSATNFCCCFRLCKRLMFFDSQVLNLWMVLSCLRLKWRKKSRRSYCWLDYPYVWYSTLNWTFFWHRTIVFGVPYDRHQTVSIIIVCQITPRRRKKNEQKTKANVFGVVKPHQLAYHWIARIVVMHCVWKLGVVEWISHLHLSLFRCSMGENSSRCKTAVAMRFFQLNRKTFHTCVGKFQSERMSAMRRRRRNGV